jgi:hypothetical protein
MTKTDISNSKWLILTENGIYLTKKFIIIHLCTTGACNNTSPFTLEIRLVLLCHERKISKQSVLTSVRKTPHRCHLCQCTRRQIIITNGIRVKGTTLSNSNIYCQVRKIKSSKALIFTGWPLREVGCYVTSLQHA